MLSKAVSVPSPARPRLLFATGLLLLTFLYLFCFYSMAAAQSAVTIPQAKSTPKVDGSCNVDTEYNDAFSAPFTDAFNTTGAHLSQT